MRQARFIVSPYRMCHTHGQEYAYDVSICTSEALQMQPGIIDFPAIKRIVYGRPAADALNKEAERLGASRVYLMVSRTMNRTTDEVAKVTDALGARFAGLYDQMPALSPREN